jgi:hypothetical protein
MEMGIPSRGLRRIGGLMSCAKRPVAAPFSHVMTGVPFSSVSHKITTSTFLCEMSHFHFLTFSKAL